MFDRPVIFARYPWLKPHAEPTRVVIGDDLDAALSAALYLGQHPEARLVGIYSKYMTVYFDAALNWEEVLDAVWLDLDIYHPRCRSLGHHIVRYDARDQLPGFANSCNLNELGERSVKTNFGGKYPLGTVHFLMWLYGLELPPAPNADLLVWLADSAYINGQSRSWHKHGGGEWVEGPGFGWNVHHWLWYKIPIRSMQAQFTSIDTRAFETRMAEFQEQLKREGFNQGVGQVASRQLKLFGYQCQPVGEIGEYAQRLLQFVASETGWDFYWRQVEGLRVLQTKSGQRCKARTPEVRRVGLDAFLQSHHVFSYVFQNAGELNYTTGL